MEANRNNTEQVKNEEEKGEQDKKEDKLQDNAQDQEETTKNKKKDEKKGEEEKGEEDKAQNKTQDKGEATKDEKLDEVKKMSEEDVEAAKHALKYKLFLEQARIANSACVPVVADTAWGDRFATDLPSFMADRITMEISWLPSQLGPDVEENSPVVVHAKCNRCTVCECGAAKSWGAVKEGEMATWLKGKVEAAEFSFTDISRLTGKLKPEVLAIDQDKCKDFGTCGEALMCSSMLRFAPDSIPDCRQNLDLCAADRSLLAENAAVFCAANYPCEDACNSLNSTVTGV